MARKRQWDKPTLDKAVDEYFRLLDLIRKTKDREQRLELCKQSFPLLEPLSVQIRQEYGKFDIKSIPAIEEALEYWADNGDVASLEELHKLVKVIPGLETWEEDLDGAIQELKEA